MQEWNFLVEKMRKIHDREEYDVRFTLALLAIKSMEIKLTAVNYSKILYSIELEIHEDKPEVHRCLKKKIDADLYKVLQDAVYPGIMNTIIPQKAQELKSK